MLAKIIAADLRRYISTDELHTVFDFVYFFLFNESFWFILNYRIGCWSRTELKIPLIRSLLKLFTLFLGKLLSIVTGYQIPFSAKIGPGLYIGHTGMLIINGKAQIGSNCNLSAGIVIGETGRGSSKGVPVIGDSVYIAPGAMIIGAVSVGNNAAIGANAVVTRDVPPGVTVAGIPAKPINTLGSLGLIR